MSNTTTQQNGKPCNRCGNTIVWNNNSKFFESPEYPKFQHCCPLPCNKEGCGGTIYFSNICPKSTETGRSIPLDFPVPQVDPNNSAQMIWVVHVHKNNIPANEPPATTPAPTVPTVPEVKPLVQGQETLVANIPANVPATNTFVEAQKPQNPIAVAANRDFEGTILQTLTDISARLETLATTLEAVVPKLNVIAGKIANGSIKSASDLVAHHLSQ